MSFSIKHTEHKKKKPPVNRITLSFSSNKENKNFESYHTERSLSFVRISLILAIGLYISFAWLDPLITPDVATELMAIRIFSCLLFTAAIALSFVRWGIHNFQFLMSSLVLLAGIGLVRMVMIAESAGGYSYYAGIILAIMYAHTLLRIRFIYATITTWSVIFLYMAVNTLAGVIPFEIYISNIFFLFSANIMGMFASYWLEYYMKAVYWKEQLLKIKTGELQKEHQRKSDELDDARKMQLSMLPNQLPDCDQYMFSFSMKAASEVGGDYYDYHLDDDGNLTFGIGDATGHGLKAGIMVTAMKLLFSEKAGQSDLVEFLKKASHSIHLMKFNRLFMAFAIGRLYDNDRLELAGAGMPSALIYRFKYREIEEIPLKGMPLGTSVEFPYQKTVTKIDPGDIVLLMTDGLAESFNKEKEMFGYERIKDLLTTMADQTPKQIIQQFYKIGDQWSGSGSEHDDMTFFVFKRNLVKEKKDLEEQSVSAFVL